MKTLPAYLRGISRVVVDAAVGTVRIGGKIVGAGADAVLGSDDPK